MKTITFYSYKGGVGRSLALVNIATRLAEFGKKVCLLDFDLEAPGLPLKFSRYLPQSHIEKGIVDYVAEYTASGYLPEKIEDFGVSIKMAKNSSPLFIIPAGDINDAGYWKKLSSINWNELLYENHNGIAFFLDLKQKIEYEINPDFLLIDSRTGISEMSEISLSLLADEVVIVAANNRENLGGTKRILKALTNPDNTVIGNPPKITFVLSRIPFTDKPEDKAKESVLIKKILREYLYPFVTDVNVIHSDRDLEENEQIKIAYDKDDNLAQSSRDYLSLFEKVTQNDLTEEEIILFKSIRAADQLYQQAMLNQLDSSNKLYYISEAIKLNPNNIDFYISAAEIHDSQRRYEQALEIIDTALLLDDKSLMILHKRIEYLYRLRRYSEARTEISKVLKINEHDLYAHHISGLIYSKEKLFDKSLEVFNLLKTLYPEIPQIYTTLAHVKRLKGDLEEALDDVYKALEMDPDLAYSYTTLAEINAEMGNLRDFYLHLETALKLNTLEIGEFINIDEFYRQFYESERFKQLMEKYNIPIDPIEKG